MTRSEFFDPNAGGDGLSATQMVALALALVVGTGSWVCRRCRAPSAGTAIGPTANRTSR
jgi:hypothetical protein